MTEQKIELTITEMIDADEGLKSKRKLLVVASLILLALSFSGAKLEEANTFILKLKFENQQGIAVLLVLAIVFLLIRYLNYARPYHDKIYKAWSDRMLDNSYFFSYCPHSDEVWGLVVSKAQEQINFSAILSGNEELNYVYKSSPPFSRKINYHYIGEHHDHIFDVSIGWKVYPRVIAYEFKYQFGSFFTHRENLDILAPYALGLLAIASYLFNEKLQLVLKMLAVS